MSYDAETKSVTSVGGGGRFGTRTRTRIGVQSSQLHDGIRGFYSRVNRIMGLKRQKHEKRSLEISAPFNFQKGSIDLAGVSADELCMLREQAAASCIGIADADVDDRSPDDRPLTPRTMTSGRRPPIAGMAKSVSGPVLNFANDFVVPGSPGIQSPVLRQSV